jgi:hypothetical protein
MREPTVTEQSTSRVAYFDRIDVVTPDDPRRLDAIRAPGAPDPPEEMQRLWEEIRSLVRVVTGLFADDLERRKIFFEHLHVTADTGMRGQDYSLTGGWHNIVEVKSEITHAFPVLRSKIWRSYFKTLVFMLLVPLPLGAVIYYASLNGLWGVPPPTKSNFDLFVVIMIAACWIPVGVALGIFLEFIFSVGEEISFEKLLLLNPGRWNPAQRLVNTILTAWCFAFIMGIQLMQIGVMNVLLNDFARDKPYLALVVGFVTGFAFPYVREIMYKLRPVVART